MKKELNKAVAAAFVVFVFWIMAVKNGFMLKWYDEMSLFESGPFFLHQSLHYPGGLLRYAGSYLTQLMYYPYLGTGAIVLLWLLMAWLTGIAFGLRGRVWPLTLVVPLALVVSIVQLDEAWLSMKSTGYVFFNTLGYLFTIAVYILYRRTERWPVAGWAVALVTVLCYAVAGFFALLAGVLCAIRAVERGRGGAGRACYAESAIILLAVAAVPVLYYTFVPGNTADNDYLHLKGLPELMMEPYDLYLWSPFAVATLSLVLFSVFGGRGSRSAVAGYMALGAVAAGCVWCVMAERKSEQLRATVLMQRCLERDDWRGMLHVMSLTKESPNYSMLVLKNLAVVNLGGESQPLSQLRPSNLDARHSESFTMTAFVQVPVNYYVGRINQSYRWAMEHSVQYGKRVFFLKYMVKDALLRGEIRLARRYNDMLKTTMFHRKWAQEMERYIDEPSLIGSNPEFAAVLSMVELEKARGGESHLAEIQPGR